ncbi:MAG: ERAP1-like C-terminal domain-containing protein, partial [Bryobacteraceae bacterium]
WKLKAASCPAWVEGDNRAVGYYRVHYSHNLLNALASGDVTARLSAAERVDFMGNAAALSNAGKLSMADALGLVEKFHADPERYVVMSALQLAAQPVIHLVPENLMPNFRRFIDKSFQARAEKLGWTPKPGELDNVKLLRPMLLRIVSTYGGDKKLAGDARALTDKWLKDHSAVPPTLVAAVLGASAYYGDQALFNRYLAAFQKTNDRHQRERIIAAMDRFRDPSVIKAGMQAVLSGQIPFMEGYGLLFAGQRQAATRRMAFDFLKAHYAEIVKDRPQGGGFDMGAYLPEVGIDYCTEQGKAEIENFFKPRIGQFTGGPRMLSQVVEGIGVCIAEKKVQEPSVVAFLKKY